MLITQYCSGYNTNQALKIVDAVVPDPSVSIVRFLVIFFGANDACLKGAPGSQHVPLEQYKRNLESLITHPKVSKQQPRIILVTPPPINEYACEENDRTKGYFEPRRSAKHTQEYAIAAKEIGKAQGVAVLDLFQVFMSHAGQEEGSEVLEGSKERPPNPFFRMLLHDGMFHARMH